MKFFGKIIMWPLGARVLKYDTIKEWLKERFFDIYASGVWKIQERFLDRTVKFCKEKF